MIVYIKFSDVQAQDTRNSSKLGNKRLQFQLYSWWAVPCALCLWCSRPVTAFKFMPVLFFSICKPRVTAPVGNHVKVLRTPALETDRLCKSIQQGRGAGSGRGEVDSFTYNFLLSHLLYLHLLTHSVSTLSFKLRLITSMHFPTYLPTQHFLKTIASPRKCNKTLQKEEAIVVWAGWL